MRAVNTPDLQGEECPLLDVQILRRKVEVLSGHLDCLTWYLGGVKASRDRIEFFGDRTAKN
jgi:hypothetical protein